MILGGFVLLGFSRQYCFLFPLSFNSVSLKTVVITTKMWCGYEKTSCLVKCFQKKYGYLNLFYKHQT
jgi:hypothetical protein